jgi:hypothetical protein
VVGGGDGLDPLRVVVGEVGVGQEAVVLVGELDDGVGDGAAVEGVGAVFSDEVDAGGEVDREGRRGFGSWPRCRSD